jgi:hypothetical protein
MRRKSTIDLSECLRLIRNQRYRDAVSAFDRSLDKLIKLNKSSKSVDVAKELKKLVLALEKSFRRSYVENQSERKSGDTNSDSFVCSFCGKDPEEIKQMIAGPSVYICNECVDLCNDILGEELDTNESIGGKIEADLLNDDRIRVCVLCAKPRSLDDVVYIPAVKYYFCVECVEAHVAAKGSGKNE